jgi:hypothetical protein
MPEDDIREDGIQEDDIRRVGDIREDDIPARRHPVLS